MQAMASVFSGRIVPIVVIVAIAGGWGSTSHAAPPESRPQRIARLIKQLDADTRAARVQAERQLLEIGPGLLPHLPPPELLPSNAVRETVKRVRVQLERRRAADSVRASQVTLGGRLTLEAALQAIRQQTGNRIDASRLPAVSRRQTFSTDLRNASFWSTVDEICRQTELDLQFADSPDGPLLVKSVTSSRVPVAYSGPFRLSAATASLRPIFGDEQHRLVRVTLDVASEPRLRPLFLTIDGSKISATAAAGELLPALNPEARLELPLSGRGRSASVQLDFKTAADVALSRVDLVGTMSMQLAANTQRIAFPKLPQSSGVARRRGGVTVTVKKTAFTQPVDTGHEIRVQVSVGYDAGGPAFESHRTWIFHNEVFLETSDGRRIALNGRYQTSLESDGGVRVEYQFQNVKHDPGDLRFVYLAPTLIVDVPVRFKIDDVPVTPRKKTR